MEVSPCQIEKTLNKHKSIKDLENAQNTDPSTFHERVDSPPDEEEIIHSTKRNGCSLFPESDDMIVDQVEYRESKTVENSSLDCDRRKSLRPRGTTKNFYFVENDDELDEILDNDENSQIKNRLWDDYIGSSVNEKWFVVEKILTCRPLKASKITKAMSNAIENLAHVNSKMLQYEYFVKFLEQSYWHCAWMSGVVLMILHPNKLRSFYKSEECKILSPAKSPHKRAVEVNNVTDPDNDNDAGSPEKYSTDDMVRNLDSVSTLTPTISHSSEEETDDEDHLEKWTENSEFEMKKLNPNSANMGSRRSNLIKFGVESYALVPERVLAVGDTFSPERFEHTKSNVKIKTTGFTGRYNWPKYHEVLVKWAQLPYNQATWETVELEVSDLSRSQCKNKIQKSVIKVLDPCGYSLLPRLVRRHIIQLANIYLTHVATMLSDAYGNHLIPDRRNIGNKNWETKWVDKQPDYISPSHGGKLHSYQMEGVRWLWHSYHTKVNTILADEMGLGKTVQVIALLYSLWKEENDYGPFLILAPLSAVHNWEREFTFWAPDFYVVMYCGDKWTRNMVREHEFRVPNCGDIPVFHVLITSHELACIDYIYLRNFDWSVVVVDEAHRLKNKQSRFFKCTSQFRTRFKILLTGTPLQNNLEELFHLLNYVEPNKFSDFKGFSAQLAELPKAKRIAYVHDLLKSHLLRRVKIDVMNDLPTKTEIIVPVDMTILQRRLYKLILTRNYKELRSGSLFNCVMHLQKLCDHPYLIQAGDAIAPRLNPNELDSPYEPKALIEVSAKLVVLMQLLHGLKAQHHRVLIFSRLTMMLDLLEEVLTNENYKFERIDGRVRGPMRQVIIDRFNDPNSDSFIFLLSTRACGEGVNLASADTVILYDSDWNPYCDLQALSRAHRIGQSHHVVIYRFLTRNSLEEKITYVARRKLALTKLIVNQKQVSEPIQCEPVTPSPLMVKPIDNVTSEESQTITTTATGDNNFPADATPPSTDVRQDHWQTVDQSPNNLITTSRNSSIGRLNRAEMNEMLRSGVETLFTVDDGMATSDLVNAVHTGADNNFTKLIYDAKTISRLLDRSQMQFCTEQGTSTTDDYLSSFKVAYFDEISRNPPLPSSDINNNNNNNPVTSDVSTDQANEANNFSESGAYAEFWDKLLLERHQRLSNIEEASEVKQSRRNCRVFYSAELINEIGCDGAVDDDDEDYVPTENESNDDDDDDDDDDGDDDGEHNRVNKDNELVFTIDRVENTEAIGHDEGGNHSIIVQEIDERTQIRRAKRNKGSVAIQKELDTFTERGILNAYSSGLLKRMSLEDLVKKYKKTRAPRLKEILEFHIARITGPTFDFSTIRPLSSRMRKQNLSIYGKNHPSIPANTGPESGNTSHSVEITDGGASSEWESVSHITVVPMSVTNKRSGYKRKWSWQKENSSYPPCCWHPTSVVHKNWRDRLMKSGVITTMERGELFIYSFGPNDRQLFANAVMRYGLPPPGIIPPQDWLPPALYYKSQIQLYGYTSLFMKHIYSDANARSEAQPFWSDGLPKENLCIPTVLSRIAIMSLIRHKVVEFEDSNGYTSKPGILNDQPFEFDIYEGGLTLLRSIWGDEHKQLNVYSGSNRRAFDENYDVTTITNNLNETIWHSQHDYWLLAGIMVHGYCRWTEILADPRFHLLNSGLSVVVAKLKLTIIRSNKDPSTDIINQQQCETTEMHAFLQDRLRLLEQALIVEQALLEVAQCALVQSTNGGPLTQTGNPERVANLAKCLSNKLIQTGPRKRIALPRDPIAQELAREKIKNLQALLEDMYADLPALPASLSCSMFSVSKNVKSSSLCTTVSPPTVLTVDSSCNIQNQIDVNGSGEISETPELELLNPMIDSCREAQCSPSTVNQTVATNDAFIPTPNNLTTLSACGEQETVKPVGILQKLLDSDTQDKHNHKTDATIITTTSTTTKNDDDNDGGCRNLFLSESAHSIADDHSVSDHCPSTDQVTLNADVTPNMLVSTQPTDMDEY